MAAACCNCKCHEPVEQQPKEAQFPSLAEPLMYGQAKIVSESLDDKGDHKHQVQFLDLSLGRSAIVSRNKDGEQVMFLDAASGKCYSYGPNGCEMKISADLPMMDGELVDNWNYKMIVVIYDDYYEDDRAPGEEPRKEEARVFGVAGLWKFAEQRPKALSRISKLVNSISKEIYEESLCWTVEGSDNKLLIKFYFTEEPPNESGSPQLSLRIIQIESMHQDRRLLKTINVHSVGRIVKADEYKRYLEIPVGHGPARNTCRVRD